MIGRKRKRSTDTSNFHFSKVKANFSTIQENSNEDELEEEKGEVVDLDQSQFLEEIEDSEESKLTIVSKR